MNLCIQLMVTGHYPSRVPPFGNLRIKAYLQLPEAYRSLSRPSSAISAMASTLRSYSLDLAKLLSDPPKTIERSNKSNFLSIVVVFLTLFLCSFQGAIEVFVLISYGVESRNFKTIQKLFSKHNLISYPTFRRLFAGLPPALLPVEAFYLPIRLFSLAIVPTLEVESPIRRLVSP